MPFPFPLQTGIASYPGTFGPFPTSTTVRYSIIAKNIVGPAQALTAQVSTDNGATWNYLDDAHAPVINGDLAFSTTQIGNTLWALFVDPSSVLNAIPFVTDGVGGGTWGAITPGPTLSSPGGTLAVVSCLRTQDGKIVFLETNGSVGSSDGGTILILEFGTFDPTGLVFSLPVVMSNVDLGDGGPGFFQPSNPLAICEGTSGLIHCAWGQSTDGAFNPLLFQTVNTSGVVGTLQQLATTDFNSFTSVTCALAYQPSTNRVFLAYTLYWDGASLVDDVAIVIFSPSQLNCVFFGTAQSLVVTGTGGIFANSLSLAIRGNSVNLFLGTDMGMVVTNYGYWIAPDLTGPNLFAQSATVAFTDMRAIFVSGTAFGIEWAALSSKAYYYELAAPAPPATAPLPLTPQIAIFPFPVDDPCCYSPCLVSCVQCSKNGRMYASAKTVLAKGD